MNLAIVALEKPVYPTFHRGALCHLKAARTQLDAACALLALGRMETEERVFQDV